MIKDHRLIYEAYASKNDAFINKNLSNLLTPIKVLNTHKAISYISKRMDEMIKQIRGFKDWGYILDGDNKPFYHEDGTGKLRALVSVVDNRGQRNKTGRVTVDPNMLNSRNYYDRILNIAVEEYLDMVDDETRNKKMKGESEEGSVLPDVNAVMEKDAAYNTLAEYLGSQDLSGVEDLPNGIGEAYQKGYDDLGWGKNENPFKEGTLGYYLYNWGQYDQETNG